MKSRDNKNVLIFGIIISIISFVLVFFTKYWYFIGAFGFWFFFDYFSSKKNKNTALQIFFKNKKLFFDLYLLMLALGISIEYIGRFILGWWTYPAPKYMELFVALYPIMLFSLREMYETSKIIIKNKTLSFLLAILLGNLIWEVPNIFSNSWTYTLPFESDIAGVIVVFGWSILIYFPHMIFKKFMHKKLK